LTVSLAVDRKKFAAKTYPIDRLLGIALEAINQRKHRRQHLRMPGAIPARDDLSEFQLEYSRMGHDLPTPTGKADLDSSRIVRPARLGDQALDCQDSQRIGSGRGADLEPYGNAAN